MVTRKLVLFSSANINNKIRPYIITGAILEIEDRFNQVITLNALPLYTSEMPHMPPQHVELNNVELIADPVVSRCNIHWLKDQIEIGKQLEQIRDKLILETHKAQLKRKCDQHIDWATNAFVRRVGKSDTDFVVSRDLPNGTECRIVHLVEKQQIRVECSITNKNKHNKCLRLLPNYNLRETVADIIEELAIKLPQFKFDIILNRKSGTSQEILFNLIPVKSTEVKDKEQLILHANQTASKVQGVNFDDPFGLMDISQQRNAAWDRLKKLREQLQQEGRLHHTEKQAYINEVEKLHVEHRKAVAKLNQNYNSSTEAWSARSTSLNKEIEQVEAEIVDLQRQEKELQDPRKKLECFEMLLHKSNNQREIKLLNQYKRLILDALNQRTPQ